MIIIDNKTKKALDDSIKHWQRLLDAYTRRDRRKMIAEGWRGKDCPLCAIYVREFECSGCPIAADTGEGFCRSTPWTMAALALENSSFDIWNKKHHVKRELSYLKKLGTKCIVEIDDAAEERRARLERRDQMRSDQT